MLKLKIFSVITLTNRIISYNELIVKFDLIHYQIKVFSIFYKIKSYQS